MLLLVAGTEDDPTILDLREEIERRGIRTRMTGSRGRTSVLRCVGDTRPLEALVASRPDLTVIDGGAHPLVAYHPDQERTVVDVPARRRLRIGGTELSIIAGPCSVESYAQIMRTARGVASAGAGALRGGAFKPRTSPYPFQGLGEQGLELLVAAREATGLPVVTEVMDPRLVSRVAETADVLQIGSRNMQNYALLDEVGRVQRPVLLKRGLASTLEELMLAAERIVYAGNDDVVLCERGIRTYERATRNTLDVAAIAVLRERTHLPVLVDPSHAAGRRELVQALALAGIAAGADGLLVEVHADPDRAYTDARQSLSLEMFETLMRRLKPVAEAVGRIVVSHETPGRKEA